MHTCSSKKQEKKKTHQINKKKHEKMKWFEMKCKQNTNQAMNTLFNQVHVVFRRPNDMVKWKEIGIMSEK